MYTKGIQKLHLLETVFCGKSELLVMDVFRPEQTGWSFIINTCNYFRCSRYKLDGFVKPMNKEEVTLFSKGLFPEDIRQSTPVSVLGLMSSDAGVFHLNNLHTYSFLYFCVLLLNLYSFVGEHFFGSLHNIFGSNYSCHMP